MTTPYRSDREALEQRLAALQTELADTAAEVQALDGAVARKSRIEREIAEVADKLAGPSPLLEGIRIASPCNASWDDMVGDDRSRFCGSCQKNVYDLSKMTRREGEELIRANETACVRLWKRRDGRVLTSDCPVGRRRKRFRRIVAAAVGTSVVAGAMILRWRMTSPEPEIVVVAGGIEAAPGDSSVPIPSGTAVADDPPPAPATSNSAATPLPTQRVPGTAWASPPTRKP